MCWTLVSLSPFGVYLLGVCSLGGSPTASVYSSSWSISLTRDATSLATHGIRILSLTFSYAHRRASILALRPESSARTTHFVSPLLSSLRRPISSAMLNISSWRSSSNFPASWCCSSGAASSPKRTFFAARRGWFHRGCGGHQLAPFLSLRCMSHLSL